MFPRDISACTVFGILGNITAFGFYASSAPTIYNHLIKETVEDSQPYAYLAALMNCMICFEYALPFGHPFNWPLLIINAGGFLLEITYIGIFYYFSPADLRGKIKWILAGVLAYVIVLPLVLHRIYIIYGIYTPDVLGIHFIFTGILMYGSPTIIIREVFQTKSVEHVPLATTIIGLFNAVFWTAYSLLSSDLYILVPNAMGIIFSAFEFIVFLCFKFCCAPESASVEEEEGEGTERERESAVPLAIVNPTLQIGGSSSSHSDYRPLEQNHDVDSPLSSPLLLRSRSVPSMKEFLPPSGAQP